MTNCKASILFSQLPRCKNGSFLKVFDISSEIKHTHAITRASHTTTVLNTFNILIHLILVITQ